MLNCVVDMINKTKHGINLLQSKALNFQKQIENYDSEMKRKYTDLISNAMKVSEEKISVIKKRAG